MDVLQVMCRRIQKHSHQINATDRFLLISNIVIAIESIRQNDFSNSLQLCVASDIEIYYIGKTKICNTKLTWKHCFSIKKGSVDMDNDTYIY